MAITASQVNELRQLTGVGMMDCKKALVECDGDMQKAIELLRQTATPTRVACSPRPWATAAPSSC